MKKKPEQPDDMPPASTLSKFIHVLLLDHMTLSEIIEVIDEASSMSDYELYKDRLTKKSFMIAQSLVRKLR